MHYEGVWQVFVPRIQIYAVQQQNTQHRLQDERSRELNTLSNLHIKHLLGVLVLGRIVAFTPRQFLSGNESEYMQARMQTLVSFNVMQLLCLLIS